MKSDEELMEDFYACDSSACEAIIKRWWLPLCSRFRRQCEICRNRGRAEDLTQVTLIKVFATKDLTSGSRYSPQVGAFKSWLYKIADNVHHDVHRYDNRHPEDQMRDYEIGEEG